jgi:T-complex protein 1 subunit zeta
MAASEELLRYKNEVTGKVRLGVQAYADALLVIPKTLGK